MMHDVPAPGRRERVRAATVEEIKATARRILVDEGAQGVTLRAIARDMGMTAPALYRYFPSHEDLWRELCHDTYDDITDAIEATIARLPGGDADERLIVATRAFRSWAADHPREFGLVFGMPLPGVQELAGPEDMAGKRFAILFTTLFAQLWVSRPFEVPADEEIPPALRAQLQRYRDAVSPLVDSAAVLPLGAIQRFLQGWVQLYGVVTMEVFGHLGFCLDDVSEFFEAQLAAIATLLGMPPPPRPSPADPSPTDPSPTMPPGSAPD